MDFAQHPEIAAQGGFGHLRLGRIKPPEPPKLDLANYVDTVVIQAPPSADFYSAVPSWPMYGNDELGDCTCAAAGHLVQAWSAAAGGMKTMDDADIERMYWETGNPPEATGEAGGPTDDGRYETKVLGYWRAHGIAPGTNYTDRIVAYARVDRHDPARVKSSIALLGGVYIGIAMPLTAQAQEVWDVDGDLTDPNSPAYPGSWGGHAVPIVGYDADHYALVTWGALMRMTPAFFAAYVDEVYAVISADMLAGRLRTVGFNQEGLATDLATVTEHVGEAAGGDLPTEETNTATAPAEAQDDASEPVDAPETPPQPSPTWRVSVDPMTLGGATEVDARAQFVQAIVEDGSLIKVEPNA